MRENDLSIPTENQQSPIATFANALDRYVSYRSQSLSDRLSLDGDQIAERLIRHHDGTNNHIDIVIPTYKPDAGILWGLDQLSRQHGTNFRINVFHNGIAAGSLMPDEFYTFADKAGIRIDESNAAHGVNGSKYEGARLAINRSVANQKDNLVVIMDDDSGPIFPGWLAKADTMFKENPNLMVMYSQLLFADQGLDFALALLYKASALSTQYVLQKLGKSNHTTEGIAAYRAGFLRDLLAKTQDFTKLYGTTVRMAALQWGEVAQVFDPKMLCFVDPSRIKKNAGMLKYAFIQLMLHAPSDTLREIGDTKYKEMYSPKERA